MVMGFLHVLAMLVAILVLSMPPHDGWYRALDVLMLFCAIGNGWLAIYEFRRALSQRR